MSNTVKKLTPKQAQRLAELENKVIYYEDSKNIFLITGLYIKEGMRFDQAKLVYMTRHKSPRLFSRYLKDAELLGYEEGRSLLIQTCVWNPESEQAIFPAESIAYIKVEGAAIDELNHIAKWQLRKRLQQEFKMNKNTPFSILADMCEDKGMTKEAELLRLKV